MWKRFGGCVVSLVIGGLCLAVSHALGSGPGIGYRLAAYATGDMAAGDTLLKVGLPVWLRFAGWLAVGYGMGSLLPSRGRGACCGVWSLCAVGMVAFIVIAIVPMAVSGARELLVTWLFGSYGGNTACLVILPAAAGALIAAIEGDKTAGRC